MFWELKQIQNSEKYLGNKSQYMNIYNHMNQRTIGGKQLWRMIQLRLRQKSPSPPLHPPLGNFPNFRSKSFCWASWWFDPYKNLVNTSIQLSGGQELWSFYLQLCCNYNMWLGAKVLFVAWPNKQSFKVFTTLKSIHHQYSCTAVVIQDIVSYIY